MNGIIYHWKTGSPDLWTINRIEKYLESLRLPETWEYRFQPILLNLVPFAEKSRTQNHKQKSLKAHLV